MRIINAPVPCLEASKLVGQRSRAFFKRQARRDVRHALVRLVKAEVDSVMHEREELLRTKSFTHSFLTIAPSDTKRQVSHYVVDAVEEGQWSLPTDRLLHARNGQVLASCDMSDMHLMAA